MKVFGLNFAAMVFCFGWVLILSTAQRDDDKANLFNNNDISISQLNVLLPRTITKKKVQYKLEAYNGCFKWFSTNPEVATVEPIFVFPEGDRKKPSGSPFDDATAEEKCSQRAWIVAQTTAPRRSSTWVIAEETMTGRLLRCEVFVDDIKTIEILTTTRFMYRDDVESLEVQAFDADGNLFSTLDRIQFQWSIQPTTSASGGSSVLKMVPFKESTMEVPPSLLKMEEEGLESFSVLIQGIDNGKATVAARIVELGYTDVPRTTVELTVLEPLQLSPIHPVYVTPGTQVAYQLQTHSRDVIRTIEMPNPQYIWSSSDTNVAVVDRVGLLTAIALGETTISAQYANMLDSKATASVYVVQPAYLGLKLVTEASVKGKDAVGAVSTNWYLVSGYVHVLEIEVYDRDSHKLYSTENLYFNLKLDNEYFNILSSSVNKNHHKIIPIKEGPTMIIATLEEILNVHTGRRNRLTQPLVFRQEVTITKPVKITPNGTIILPWDLQVKHQYRLEATGGSGEYNWYSADNSIVSVSAVGTLLAQGLGGTTIMVVDRKNPANRDTVEALCLSPVSIGLMPDKREVEVGSPLILPVAVFDSLKRSFHNCSALPLQWELDDPSVFSMDNAFNFTGDNSSLFSQSNNLIASKDSCSLVALYANKEGHSTLTVYYEDLRAQIILFAFNPFKLILPSNGASRVTLGSSASIVFEGGPNPWLFEPSAYFESMVAKSTTGVRFTEVVKIFKIAQESATRHRYRVVCLEHGNHALTITVGNRPTSTNPNPATSSMSTEFFCQPPAALFLLPEQPTFPQDAEGVANLAKCTEGFLFPQMESMLDVLKGTLQWPSRTEIRNDRQLEIRALIVDTNGRLFDNSSSLAIKWSSSNFTLAHFVENLQAEYIQNEHVSETKDANPEKHIRIVELAPLEGRVIISSSITGYDTDVLRQAGIRQILVPTLNSPTLSHQLGLLLRSNVRLTPSRITIYNHPNNTIRLYTTQGSRHHIFRSNNSEIVSLNHKPGANFLEVTPNQAGVVKITVEDLCLDYSLPTHSIVHASDISQITLRARDMVRLGETTLLEIDCFDSAGIKFDVSQYKFMNFSIQFTNEMLSLAEAIDQTNTKFSIEAQVFGAGSITVSSTQRDGSVVYSDPLTIHVFRPFTVHPRKMVLLPGAFHQVQYQGGPPFRGEVLFRVDDPSVASVDPALGIVVSKDLGSTKVHAVMTGYDSVTGNRLVVGRDVVEVVVKPLTGIRIYAASDHLLLGEELTLRVTGASGETPFTFGSFQLPPGIRFRWEVTNSEVASLRPIYQSSNSSLEEESDFSVRVQAKVSGKTRISVHVTSAPNDMINLLSYSASIPLTVIEPLRLISPSNILMLPVSTSKIITNKDNSNRLRFQLLSYGSCDPNLSGQNVEIISIDQRGVIQSRGAPGWAVIQIQDKAEISRELPSVLVFVTVKPAHILQLIPNSEELVLPVGSLTNVTIKLMDDLGRSFDDCEGVSFQFYVNHLDIVSIKRPVELKGLPTQFVVIHALQPGECIARVYVENNDVLDDYLRIRVGNAILPSFPVVHLGGTIEFATSFKDRQIPSSSMFPLSLPSFTGQRSFWRSEDPRIVEIDSASGVARAKSLGSTVVSHNGTVYTYTPVVVTKVSEIEVDINEGLSSGTASRDSGHSQQKYSSKLQFITDVIDHTTGKSKEYRFPLIFYGGTNREKLNNRRKNHNEIDQAINYRCLVFFEGDATSTAQFDATTLHEEQTDTDYCVIIPRTTTRWGRLSQLSERGPVPDHVVLLVTATDITESYLTRQKVSLPFVTSFYIGNVDSSTDNLFPQLRLHPRKRSQHVEIRHSKGALIVANPANEEVSTQIDVRKVDSFDDYYTIFEIRARKDNVFFTNSPIEILCEQTKQREILQVSYLSESSPFSNDSPRSGEDTNSRRVYVSAGSSTLQWGMVWFLLILFALVVSLCCLYQNHFGNSTRDPGPPENRLLLNRPPRSFDTRSPLTSPFESRTPQPRTFGSPLNRSFEMRTSQNRPVDNRSPLNSPYR